MQRIFRCSGRLERELHRRREVLAQGRRRVATTCWKTVPIWNAAA